MYFYIIVFVFCIIMLIINNYLKEQKEKKIFEIITLFILCIISGTRYYLGGTDYYAYERIFESVPYLSKFDFMRVQNISGTYGSEIGYLFLCSVIKTLGFNFFGFTLVHSVIFYICLYIGLKKYTKNFNFLIIIFLYKIFFYNTFISMRQSITIAIFFIAIRFIQEKKIIKYFLCCTLAVLFHNGALLLYFVYFINKIKLTKKRIIILNCIFIPTMIISFLNIPFLSQFQGIVNLFSNNIASYKMSNLINSVPDSRN